MVAGPWFTVHVNGGEWTTLGQVWISNGDSDCRGRIDARVQLVIGGAADDPARAAGDIHVASWGANDQLQEKRQ